MVVKQLKCDDLFRELTGHAPFPLQRRLFAEHFRGRRVPVCSLPAGLGKTSVRAVWLLALAPWEPRRVVWWLAHVVNLRKTVSQATHEAETRLEAPSDRSVASLPGAPC